MEFKGEGRETLFDRMHGHSVALDLGNALHGNHKNIALTS